MRRVIDLDSGARLVAFVGEVATVEATEPHPVGARVIVQDGATMTAAGKVIEVSRRDGNYRLRLRLFSPSASVRAALLARLAGHSDTCP